MPIHVALHHRSHYRYDRPVHHSPHVVRLRPAPHSRTRVLSYSMRVLPAKHFINWQQDPFGNYLARLVFPEKTAELMIEIDLVAEMAVLNPFDFFLEPSAEKFPFAYSEENKRDLLPFLETTAAGPKFEAFVGSIDRTERRTIDFLVALNLKLSHEIKYLIRLEPGVQTPEETLELGSGSCRDTGWLLVQVLRRLGLAARFVSGYLIQLKPDQKSLDGPSGAEMDFTDLHAWCEVYLPGAGWIGLDPTSGLLAGEGHIPLACTPEPAHAAPVTGAVDECKSEFAHEMRVQRIYESPRVTKPYSETQWCQIEALGKEIDEEMQRADVRLTMGGEPTFISIDNMDGEEWNFTAVGPEKRKLSAALIRRLKTAFAPGGLLHFGQGKWYPGESLPRWAFACYWRKDGEPIWNDPSLLADENIPTNYRIREAEQFMQHLARVLNLKSKYILPAFEDAWYYMWRERRLPSNVDPLASNLSDKEERDRLGKVFDQGLNRTVGYVLPLQRRTGADKAWISGSWFLRPETLFLTPGDSPIGLRLPLDSLPWVAPADYPHIVAPDPFEKFGPLPAAAARPPQTFLQAFRPGIVSEPRTSRSPGGPSAPAPLENLPPGPGQSADWIVRTALCVEPRQGHLYVFMPPVQTTEDYLDLISAVERTAADLRLPVVIEGAAPPHDPRLNHIKATPDPGVIEVNLHPANNWPELVRSTNLLYEEARQTRLGTEKFMIDGRHVGTGGGNHFVLGGATPPDSPFLRRPDLLRSLLTYWQHHPALSFLFSGLFIGPTSQHPRVDEARNDALGELEIAFDQIPKAGHIPPWLVDRIFRNLLIDVTGNTHRAEFCIDKLFSPDSAAGRLGLIELRAFEMPPHAQMSLTQQLLLRAFIARFWKQPYEGALVRWGTQLHDRFMLPHFVQQDLEDIIQDMNAHGYPLKSDWFDPHFEFRFPLYGDITKRGVNLEVRQALEPWHVLGEQGEVGGTVRYVDSSIDRLQVKVKGMIDRRHVVTYNGKSLPLHPTGREGEFVAGVRFRGWQPPECLHPTIPVQAPLIFDIVDGWNGRSIGGCAYHVAHPGGRSYNTLPVNAYEAESRRHVRFFNHGHTPGPMNIAKAQVDPEFPFTLDLRKA